MKHIGDLLKPALDELEIKRRLIARYEINERLCGDCGAPLDDVTTNACGRCARLNKYENCEGDYDTE